MLSDLSIILDVFPLWISMNIKLIEWIDQTTPSLHPCLRGWCEMVMMNSVRFHTPLFALNINTDPCCRAVLCYQDGRLLLCSLLENIHKIITPGNIVVTFHFIQFGNISFSVRFSVSTKLSSIASSFFCFNSVKIICCHSFIKFCYSKTIKNVDLKKDNNVYLKSIGKLF